MKIIYMIQEKDEYKLYGYVATLSREIAKEIVEHLNTNPNATKKYKVKTVIQ